MKSYLGWTTLSFWSPTDGSIAPPTEQLLRPARSNNTHLVWYDDDTETPCSTIQPMASARNEAYRYLREQAMELDTPFLETLGFHKDDIHDTDGLAHGLVQQVLNVSLQAKIDFAYTDALSKDIWNQYVLNYSHLNEARHNVRRLLRDRLVEPLLLKNNNATISLEDTVRIINQHMWKVLAPSNTTSIRFVSGQTPAIFDSMSVLAFGYASCTGTSILFAEALRAAGVPARIVGTAAWNGDPNKGNHNWVEVWNGTQWKFLEPSPGLDNVDTLERKPCSRWFCNPQHMGNGTQVFAAALERTGLYFPLAWEPSCMAVPAINRTEYYANVCSSCGTQQQEENEVSAIL